MWPLWVDVSEDPVELLAEHFGIDAHAPWLDGGGAEGGEAFGWEDDEVKALYETESASGVERVAPGWWLELVQALLRGDTTYLLLSLIHI